MADPAATDAWTLAALLTCRGADASAPVALRDLVSAGDYLNHAVFMTDELTTSLARLAASEIITLDLGLAPTQAAATLTATARQALTSARLIGARAPSGTTLMTKLVKHLSDQAARTSGTSAPLPVHDAALTTAAEAAIASYVAADRG